MRKLFFSLVGLAIMLGGTNESSAQYNRWNPYLELEGRAGDGAERGQGRVFAPIFQDDSSMLFGDIRLMYTDQQAFEGNFGLGYRQLINNRRLWGAYGFFDVKDTHLNNTFLQGSFGAELLDINWGLRANGYIPELGSKSAPGGNAFLQGGQIFVQGNRERAYYGMDVEAEHILWRSNRPTSNLNVGDLEFWAAAGYFYFDNDATNFHEIAGPRARLEARLYDLPVLGNDSRIVASYQYEYDDVRGSVNQGFLNVRIPFGPGGCKGCRPKMSLLDRRMVTPIVRDIDIVTNIAQDGRIEEAKNAFTGTILDDVTTLTAAVDVQAMIEGGNDDQVFILDGVDGVEMLNSAITLNDGQILIGGGGSMNVIGCDTGLEAVFTADGAPFTFDQMNGGANVINLTNNNGIYGITTMGGLSSIGGVSPGNFEVAGNTLTGANLNAIGLLPIGGSVANGNIVNNNFVGTGGDAIGVLTVGGSDVDLMIASNSFDMIGGNGVGVTATLGTADINVTIDDNDFNGVEDDAVSIGIPTGLTGNVANPIFDVTVTNNRIIGNGATENGIDIFTGGTTDLTLLVDNNVIDGVNGDAIQIDSDTVGGFFLGFIPIFTDSEATHDVMITNNMILGGGISDDGIDIELNDEATLTGIINGNTIDDVNDSSVAIQANNDSIVTSLMVNENSFLSQGATTEGIEIDVADSAMMTFSASNNTFDNIDSDAIEIDVDDDGFLDLTFNDNTIIGRDSTSDGVDIAITIDAVLTGEVTGNTFTNLTDSGIEIDANDDTDLSLVIQSNTFMNVADDNININAQDDSALDVDILDNTMSGGEFGLNIFMNSGDDDNVLTIGGNTINIDSASAGIFIDANGNVVLDSNMQDNTVSNDGAGMIFNIDDDGDVQGTITINGVDEVFAP